MAVEGPRRVLIPCRGAAAAPVLRWARQAGVETVVLARELDAEAPWIEGADFVTFVPELESRPWPGPSTAVEAALDGGCEAVHPSWGPLSQDPEVASSLALSGLLWVGPTRDQLGLASQRHQLRALAEELGVPTVPASPLIQELAHAEAWLAHAGLPVVIRALAPGVPRVLVESEQGEPVARVAELLQLGPVLLERWVRAAREVEVPFLGAGEELAVFVPRETSVRDAHGRVLVEEPAPGLEEDLVDELQEYTRVLVEAVGWRGLGALRFLVSPDGRAYLLQVKAGLQPWDASLEERYGIDLVDVQLRLAADEPLMWQEEDLETEGVCLSMMLRALEDGELGPTHWPEEVRVDTVYGRGDPVEEGEIVAILTVKAPTRQAAIVKARVALDAASLEGMSSNLRALRELFDDERIWQGPVDRDRAAEVLMGSTGPSAGVERSGR